MTTGRILAVIALILAILSIVPFGATLPLLAIAVLLLAIAFLVG